MLTSGINRTFIIETLHQLRIYDFTDDQLEFCEKFADLIIRKTISKSDSEPVKDALKTIIGVGYE